MLTYHLIAQVGGDAMHKNYIPAAKSEAEFYICRPTVHQSTHQIMCSTIVGCVAGVGMHQMHSCGAHMVR